MTGYKIPEGIPSEKFVPVRFAAFDTSSSSPAPSSSSSSSSSSASSPPPPPPSSSSSSSSSSFSSFLSSSLAFSSYKRVLVGIPAAFIILVGSVIFEYISTIDLNAPQIFYHYLSYELLGLPCGHRRGLVYFRFFLLVKPFSNQRIFV
jgi:hypothetical protein